MSLCDDCIKGVRHEGTPSGELKRINGVDCYVATPEGDYPKDKVLLFLPDAFGVAQNNKLLVDDFARNGYKTVMLDYFEGDAVPEAAYETLIAGMRGEKLASLSQSFAPTFNIGEWIAKHPQEIVRPLIDKVIAALKEEGVTQFATTGYCFGGRYCFDLAFDNVSKVTIVSHPSLLKTPDDLEKYFASSKAPLLINSCPIDPLFPIEAQQLADKIFDDGKFAPGYKREYFDGCVHGFASRGDMSDPKIKAGKEGAFKAAVEWLKKYL
ncbi:hypothetical protein D9758_012752 [Tetrapyrgos nigripes]|uniref:Dienelactone hydrolase domain-containing protein n=1 Tax=Tetrapyrgos nigripes TaxID=182062 RepID=A0A8H5CTL9_9AGAR|nr:hypothetical protein D9758_012752 [Tetrapyrgos nigripes]